MKQNQLQLTNIIRNDWKVNYLKKIDLNLLSFKDINKLEDIKMLESNLNKT
jgi:hypothetical protein